MRPSDSHLLDLAWLDDHHAFLATGTVDDDEKLASVEQLRPLSLGSMLAIELMGLTLLDPAHTLTSDEEMEQIARYKWLHLDDLARVKRIVANGAWKQSPSLPLSESPSLELLAAFRAFRDHMAATLAAASVTVQAKPEATRNRVPSCVIGPSLFTWRVEFLAGKTGLDREHIRWHLPAPQALQMIHHHLWYDGSWTVRPSRDKAANEAAPEEFESFDLFALDPPVAEPRERSAEVDSPPSPV